MQGRLCGGGLAASEPFIESRSLSEQETTVLCTGRMGIPLPVRVFSFLARESVLILRAS